ncbi:MAG: TAXI family TRAP transporter solute-binding subunit [Brachymonas sp.]
MKLDLLFRKQWWLMYAPILLLAVALLWLSFTQWLPLPPKQVTLSVGVPGGGYSLLGMQYRKHLAELGVQVSMATTAQSHSGLKELNDNPAIDLALINGLLATQAPQSDYMALAAIEREPIWIFTRLPTLNRLAELRGLRVGVPGYDVLQERVTQVVLEQAQPKSSDVTLVPLERERLANALLDGQVDAVILMGSVRNEVARSMIRGAGIQLLGFEQVGKLLAKEKTLRPFVLPQGVIEFRGDVPSRDLTMVAVDLHLVARKNMHPALQRAIFSAATRIHEMPSFLQHQGEFPAVIGLDFPVSPTTLAAARGQRPWLEELLPYRWAQLVQWLLYAALPILLAALLLLAWIPSWFEWRVNAALQNFYGELKFLETEISSVASERPI